MSDPSRRLAASIENRTSSEYDPQAFDKRWDKGEENAAMRAAKNWHPITREMARAIVDAIDKYRDKASGAARARREMAQDQREYQKILNAPLEFPYGPEQ